MNRTAGNSLDSSHASGSLHLIDWLRGYASTRLNIDEMNKRGQVSPGLIMDFGNKGLFGLGIPAEFGGTPLSLGEILPVLEQLAAIDMTLAAMVVVHHTSSYPILSHGTARVRERYLPQLAAGRILASFAMSEPGAGSNPRAMSTAATPDGDNHWLIKGTKSWCGGAAWAGLFTVFARHVGDSERGISAFVVPRDKAGIAISEPVDTLGLRAALLRTVHFNDVQVSDQYLLGDYGSGLAVAEAGLAFGRLSTGALSVGLMKRCAQLMYRYASRRQIGTGLLLDNPVTLSRLTHVDSAILAVETLTLRLAADVDEQIDVPGEALLACKVAGSELSFQVADDLVQLLGARGYVESNIAPRLLRDARFLRIGEGPSETLLMQLGASLSTREPQLLHYLEQQLGGVVASEALNSAIEQFQQNQFDVSIDKQASQTQWEYYTLGKLGLWTFLEAAIEGCAQWPDEIQRQFTLAWIRDEFNQQLRSAIQAQLRQNNWYLPTEIESRISNFDSAIGSLDETAGVPQACLDPLLQRSESKREVRSEDLHEKALDERSWSLLIDLPTDRSYRSNEPPRHALATTQLQTTDRLHLLARRHNLDICDVVLVGFATFLWRFSHQDELEILSYDVINAEVRALRFALEDSAKVNTLLESFEHLERSKGGWSTPVAAIQSLKNKNIPSDQAVVRRVVAGGLVVCLANGFPKEDKALEGIDLCLVVEEKESGLVLSWIYDGLVYNAETIVRQSANLGVVLENLDAPNAQINTIDILPADEKKTVLYDWAGEVTDLSWQSTVSELIHLQTKVNANRPALIGRDGVISYQELDERSNRVSRRLQQLGVKPGDVVALATARSTHLIVGILGVLKSGAAFLTMNCQHPEDRLSYFFEESGAMVVLTEKSTRDRLPPLKVTQCCLDTDADIDQLPGTAVDLLSSPESLAYVMFTSGSTGRPKGVMVSHSAICNQLIWRRDNFELDSDDRVLHSAAPNFDIAVWEFLGALVTGGAIVLSGDDSMSWDAQEIIDLVQRYEVTTIQIVPSQLTTLLSHPGIEHCTTLRRVFCGGELLPRQLQEKFFSTLNIELINLYGPTEAAIDSTYWRCQPDVTMLSAPIGYAQSNKRIYVLDRQRKPVPIGVSGELLIGGVGLADGYIGQPDLTNQRFIADPFVDDQQAKMYASGDRVRFLADGSLEFLGRVDRQMKIRGVRIEPGELETSLSLHPEVAQVAVAMRQRRPGDKVLIAFYVAQEGCTPSLSSLREFAGAHLPREVVPSQFVALDELPVTTTGKVDVNALPEVQWQSAESGVSSTDNTTATESAILDIWAQLLSVPLKDPSTDFFDVGGHSLLAVQVLTRIREKFNVEVRLKEFFAKSTVHALARLVDQQCSSSSNTPHEGPIATTRKGAIPLAGTQESLWYLYQLNPDSAAYNVPDAVRLRGPLDFEKMQSANDALVQRHEALRTLFAMQDGYAEQRVQPSDNALIERVDLSGYAKEIREAELLRQIEAAAGCAFVLEQQRPYRTILFQLNEDDHALFWNFHHIIADGWSAGHVFTRDLSELYSAAVEGREVSLPQLTIQPIDYVRWQQTHYNVSQLERQLDYWKTQLVGLSAESCFPTDQPRPPMLCTDGGREFVALSNELISEIQDFSRRENMTSFTILMAAFQCLGRIYSGLDKIAVGTAVAGRQHPSAEGLIGNFANVVVIASDLSDDPTLRSVLGRTRDTMLEAVEHSDVPFERVVAELHPERELNQNPLFNVVLTLYNGSMDSLKMADLETSSICFDPKFSKFDLTFALFEVEDSIGGFIEYRSDLYKSKTIKRIVSHFAIVVQALVRQPKYRVSEIDLLTVEDSEVVLREWNVVGTPFPADRCLHQLFEDQVVLIPDNVALQIEDVTLSYAELNQRANRLARYLREQGVGPDVLVGMCIVEPSIEMFTGLLAVLKAGGAYVPIDSELPQERIEYILEGIESPILLTLQRYAERFKNSDLRVLYLDVDHATIDGNSSENMHIPVSSENLIYVIYTSGSTGKPKGVAVPHRGVSRLVCNANYATIGSTDRFAKLCNFAFDASTLEIWLPLVHGACIVAVPDRVKSLSAAFIEFVKEQCLTSIVCPTAFFHQIAADNPAAFSTLKLLIVGGEAMDGQRAREVLEGGAPERFINAYGPTEASVMASYFDLRELQPDMRTVPIGRPISNTQLYIVDEQMRPVGIGVRGELCIGGPGVAQGYLGRSDLTQKVFLPDPFSGQHTGRLYRTGDIVRYLDDGNIEYLGRSDNQVKVRGFRIEIDEIDKALREYMPMRESIVMIREDKPGNKRLVAFVVFEKSSTAGDASSVRDFLQSRLPSFMIPTFFMVLDALPVTTNGKIDRNRLQRVELTNTESTDVRIGPRDEIELRLMHIWESVLGISDLGVRSNFFESGGDSLQAMSLLSAIKEEFCKGLSLAVLYETGTIESLALQIRSSADSLEPKVLIPLVRDPSRNPLFLVHPLSGSAMCYHGIARHLQYPVYGLQSASLDTDIPPLESIPAMASCYLEAIQKVRVEGPYLLGGWSLGGIIALEIARELETQGHEVSAVIMFDSFAPTKKVKGIDTDTILALSLQEISQRFGVEAKLDLAELGKEGPDRMLAAVLQEGKRCGAMPLDAEVSVLRRLVDVCMANSQAVGSFIAEPINADIILIRAQNSEHLQKVLVSSEDAEEHDLGWSELTKGRVVVNVAPGEHMSMLFDPFAATLADRVRGYLQCFGASK